MAKKFSAPDSDGVVRRIRSAYDGSRVRVGLDCSVVPSMTKQGHKDECDINVIMKRYEQTGMIPFAERAATGRYLDVSDVDYKEAMFAVAAAQSAFAEMPAQVRDRFANDPGAMLAFLEDPKNLEEARKLGLVNPAKVPATPLAVRVVESVVGDSGKTSQHFEVTGAEPAGVPGVVAKKS